MPREVVHPQGIGAPVADYSLAITVPKGAKLVFLSGIIPLDSQGRIVGVRNIDAQAKALFERLKVVLEAAGATLDDVIKTNTYMTDLDLAPRFLKVKSEYFGSPAPAGTLVGVTGLYMKDLLVEMEAIAIVPAKE